jgi:protein CpxP
MKIVTRVLLASAIGLFCAQPLCAQPQGAGMSEQHGGMGHHMGFAMHGDSSPFMMLLKSANLTEAQKAQAHEIFRSAHEQMKPVYQQFHALHEQIAAKLLSPGTVTAADLAPFTQKAYRLQEKIDQSMVDTALAVRNLLTADQLNHLAQVHQQLQSLHAQIKGLMGGDSEEEGETSN